MKLWCRWHGALCQQKVKLHQTLAPYLQVYSSHPGLQARRVCGAYRLPGAWKNVR